MWNHSKIDFLIKYLSNTIFPLGIHMLFPDYEISIKLKKITDYRIKKFITSKRKDQTS
jgi:hypothetical protein